MWVQMSLYMGIQVLLLLNLMVSRQLKFLCKQCHYSKFYCKVGAVDIDANDCVQINSGASKIWIDHLDIYVDGDGNLDIVNASDYVTISWTKFSYTSASSDHQFSNLIGNSDSKTTDSGHLRVTLHHNWWADGVKERMPRVRFGRVHVANNLFETKTSSSCVRAGYKADLRVENNVFIGVKNLLIYMKDYTAVSVSGNYFEGTTGNTSGNKPLLLLLIACL